MVRQTFIIFSCILFFLSMPSYGQKGKTVDVKCSEEKIILNGKVYFVHEVKKGETLFSIAKAYKVTQEDIIDANPAAKDGIKKEQILKIPEAAMHAGEVVLKKSDEYKYHIVEGGQTVFSIAKKYGIKVEDLKALNPELEVSNIQINQVLKIPQNKNVTTPLEGNTKFEPSQQSISHTVTKEETLYSISKKYNTSIDQIRLLNPALKNDSIFLGQLINIPISKSAPSDSTQMNSPAYSCFNSSFCDSVKSAADKKTIRLSMLIPLFTSGGDDQTSDEGIEQNEQMLTDRNSEITALSASFLEFYEGGLLALKHLKNEGISVTANVYDTDKGGQYLKLLSEKPEFKQSDLFIGPFLTNNIESIHLALKNLNVPIVSPISQNEIFIKENPNYYQVNPSNNKNFGTMMKYIASLDIQNLIVIFPENDTNAAFHTDIIKSYFKDVSVVKTFHHCKDTCDISLLMSEHTNNFILLPSRDEVFVTNIISYLNTFTQKYSMQIFGPSTWLRYTAMDLEYLHNLQFTYFTPFFIDYKSTAVKSFLLEFRAQYGFEPTHTSVQGFSYAMLGYDLVYQFVKNYDVYGKSLGCCMSESKIDGLLCNYHFIKPSSINGFLNESGWIIRYNKNYEVEKMKEIR